MRRDHPEIASLEEEEVLKKIFEDIKIKERRSRFSEKEPALTGIKQNLFVESEGCKLHGTS
jgi:hypothetical protein